MESEIQIKDFSVRLSQTDAESRICVVPPLPPFEKLAVSMLLEDMSVAYDYLDLPGQKGYLPDHTEISFPRRDYSFHERVATKITQELTIRGSKVGIRYDFIPVPQKSIFSNLKNAVLNRRK